VRVKCVVTASSSQCFCLSSSPSTVHKPEPFTAHGEQDRKLSAVAVPGVGTVYIPASDLLLIVCVCVCVCM
jgi:hypothetical protein